MKNVKMYLASIFASLALSATAQFSGGIIGGVSTGPVKITEVDRAFTETMEGENVYGYEGGIYLKFNFNRFYLKPQLLYVAREGEVNYRESIPEVLTFVNRTADFKLEKFEAPLSLGLTVIDPYLSLEAGPVYNYIIKMTEQYNGNSMQLARGGFGYRVGFASELGPLVLHLSYQGLSNLSGGIFTGSDRATYQEPYKIIFGAGLILGSTQ